MIKVLVFAAIVVVLLPGAQNTTEGPELLEPKPTKVIAKKDGGVWKLTLSFPIQFKGKDNLDFFLYLPGGEIHSTQVPSTNAAVQYATVKAKVPGGLPTEAYLYSSPMFGKPLRLQVTQAGAEAEVIDSALGLAAAVSLAMVVVGALTAGKGFWRDLGTQTFTFKSWATNVSVGGGVLGAIVALMPGADSPYAVLSGILGAVAGLAPIAYNLSTRDVNGIQKGKVLAFVIAAAFTGISSLGLIEIAYITLGQMQGLALSPWAQWILRATVIGLWLAMALYLTTSVRDTIVAQASLARKDGSLSDESAMNPTRLEAAQIPAL